MKSAPAKIGAIVIAAAIFIFLSVWIARAYVAIVVGEKPTVSNLQTAAALDPGDADYALRLGRLYQYSVRDARPQAAIQELTRAATLNSYDPQAWLDLGTALELQGNTRKAETCLRRVDYVAPDIPDYQWDIGNFFLLHGDTDEAFHHFNMVLAGNLGYGQTIYNMAWKASGDAGKILQELIPADDYNWLDYLGYLLATHRLADATAVWDRIAASPEKFAPSRVAGYIDALISSHQPDEAYKVWGVLRDKGLIPPTDEATPENRVENGDFEEQPLNMGFGWRIAQITGIFVGLDSSVYHSATHSLLIQFPGTQNFEYRNVYEFVPVTPNHYYRLMAYMKTDGITTDSGPRMEVRDAYNPAALDKYSDALTGTTAAWHPLSIYFRTGSKTSLVFVVIARPASGEFENKIAGRVWVDDVSVVPESGPPGTTPRL
ncbi:MAG: tetratricopeptide repeat protein [Terriglobia bacterium]